MPVDRPTFHESWYRVAGLRARLRPSLEVYRQTFRGQLWHVIQDPSGNQFFRLNESAYHFIGLLDGRRSVGEAWQIANEQLGDAAPTQGEVIDLMGRLYTSNLLLADLPPDAESLFRRYRKRRGREIKGYLSNLLFARFPLYDPDRVVNGLSTAIGWLWSVWGLLLWLGIIAVGLYRLIPVWDEFWALTGREHDFLAPSRWPLLYLGFIIAKVGHEFGHALACKTFGRRAGSGGEVHVMGIMLLIFTPMPYVDASSAWAFRDKWHRTIVGCAGMLVELAIAAIAVVIWSINRSTLAHNIIFVAGISTLLFNANPLLRYDGYYILSDILEIPNLSQRSREYLQYLVRRYAWSVRGVRNPAHSTGERGWMFFYGIASTGYRVFIYISILLFLSDRLPKPLVVVAWMFAGVSGFLWAAVPIGKLIRYLATGNELSRTRGRAIASVVVVAIILVSLVGVIPFPDRFKLEGVVEPAEVTKVFARADAPLVWYLETGAEVTANGVVLLNRRPENTSEEAFWQVMSPEINAQRQRVEAEIKILTLQRSMARRASETPEIRNIDEKITTARAQRDRLVTDLRSISLRSPKAGTWMAWDLDRAMGAYIRHGQPVGMIVGSGKMVVRAIAGQNTAGLLKDAAQHGPLHAEIRVQGRPGIVVVATVKNEDIAEAGSRNLPSAALGYAAGGATAVAQDDRSGRTAAQQFFEVHVYPQDTPGARLLSGQRVIVRIDTPAKPLALQWLRQLRQLLQRKFRS